MWKSLFGRLSLAFSAILVLLSAAFLFQFYLMWLRAVAITDQMLQWSIASDVADQLAPALSPEIDERLLRTNIVQIKRLNPRVEIYFLDASGAVLGDFAESPTARRTIDLTPVRAYLSPGAQERIPLFGESPTSTKETVVFSAAPTLIRGEPGFIYVTFTGRGGELLGRVLLENAAGWQTAAAMLLSVVVAGTIGVMLFSLITRRFRQMTEVVATFSTRDFSRRIQVGGDDEVDRLSQTINSMADSIVTQVQELERRDRLRRELVSNVAHDLRAPLGLIKGYVDRIDLADGGQLTEREGELVQGISRNTESLGRLLTDLFELGKLEAQETVPQFAALYVPDLLDDFALTYRTKAKKAGVRVEVEAESSVPQIAADTTMMERVLSNLLENAIRHTPDGGRVVLRAFERGDGVCIEVEDDGQGIPQENLPYVFNREYQGGEGVQHKGMSGLGLAIVKRIVEAHGSSVSVTSTSGQGTKFSFTVRKWSAAEPADSGENRLPMPV